MRECNVLAAARIALTALAFGIVGPLWCPAVALSATKHAARTDETPFAYDTSGVVGIGAAPASVNGPAVLQFQGLTGASYDPAYGQPISLGQFVLNPASITNGLTTTYNATPFEVEIQAPGLDKTSTFPILDKLFPGLGKDLSLKTVVENSVILKGTLTGTVAPNGQTNVTATVNTIKLGSLSTSGSDHITHYTFPIHFSQLKLPSSWVMAATTVPTSTKLTLTTPATVSTTTTTTTVAQAPAIAQAQLIAATSATPAAITIAPAPAAESFTVGTPTPTPEPSTILLFATAFTGLALARRRRSRTIAR